MLKVYGIRYAVCFNSGNMGFTYVENGFAVFSQLVHGL